HFSIRIQHIFMVTVVSIALPAPGHAQSGFERSPVDKRCHECAENIIGDRCRRKNKSRIKTLKTEQRIEGKTGIKSRLGYSHIHFCFAHPECAPGHVWSVPDH